MAKITISKLRVSDKEGSLKAFANVDISGVMEIYGCKLMDGEKGPWVSMPQRKGQDGKWYDEVRIKDEKLKKEILAAYQVAFADAKKSPEETLAGASEETPF